MDAPNLDLELARMIERGDRRAAATMLVTRFASDVYALCRAMVRDGTLAEDLSQDAFGRAIAALESFRGESSPRTWLLRIARNRCLDHLAQSRRAPFDRDEHDVDAHAEDAPQVIDRIVDREDAKRALGVLGETERAIIVLHFGHGVGYGELAEAFSMKEGAVRMRVSRALARMREELGQEELRAPLMSAAAPARAAAPPKVAAPQAPAAAKRGGGLLGGLARWLRGGSADEAAARPAASAPERPADGAVVSPPARPPAPAPASASAPVPAPVAARAPLPPSPPPLAPPGAPLGAPPPALGAPAARATTAGAFAPPATKLALSHAHALHEDAPSSLLERLGALAAAA